MAETPDEVGEGKQMQLLKVSLRKAYEDIVGGFSEDEFVEQLSVSGLKRQKLASMLRIFKRNIVEGCLNDFDKTAKEENIDESLRVREELLQQQKDFVGTVAWRPSGSVPDDIRAHDMAVYKAKTKQLSVMCEMEEKQADALLAKVSKNRDRIHHCQKQLAEAWEVVNKMVDCVQHQEEAHEKLRQTLAAPGMV